MLTQLKKLFGRSGRSAARAKTAAAPRTGFTSAPTRPLAARPAPTAAPPANRPPDHGDEDVSIPLQSVLNALPPDLKRWVIPIDLGGATLTVALHKVLSQLPTGAVKLSFGELRRAAPQLFSTGDQFDNQEVALPLDELLVRINPALLPQSPKPIGSTDALEHTFNAADALLDDEIPLFSAPAKATPTKPAAGPMRVPLPASAPEIAAPIPVAVSTGQPTLAIMHVPLGVLIGSWPSTVRAEVIQLNCTKAQLALPEEFVQAGMKQGKVTFTWKTLREWITPPPPPVISNYDNTTLELPLEVLMPLFMTRLKSTPKSQPRLVVDESIPALFGPATPPETEVAPAAGSNGAASPTDDSPSKPATPGTDFKNRYISPTEVVTRASKLDGVAGALVVLPEGLLVAAELATSQDADALAAFLARAFGRVSQCARESLVGQMSHLEFAADSIPWHIFRLNGVLFAAFGLAGGSLPVAELATLAKELDRKRTT
ncbi:MAG: roadblock/LC7 domain-containing protein [Verrucomicrobiota bacterium]